MRPKYGVRAAVVVFLAIVMAVTYNAGRTGSGFAAQSASVHAMQSLKGKTAAQSFAGKTADQIAVEQAKKFKGLTLNVVWEQGLQAFDPLDYSGPLWTKLTGIKINVIQIPFANEYTKQITEHEAHSGAYDLISYAPSWTADFVADGVVMPLDNYVKKYYPAKDFQDYMPLYKTISKYKGRRYGLFDDGDVIILYYRKDLFNNAKNKALFLKQYHYKLAVPRTWKQMLDVSTFFTKHFAPKLYGYGQVTAPGNNVQNWFEAALRANGGTLYKTSSMKSAINSPIGVKTLRDFVALTKSEPKGALQWSDAQLFTSWLGGHLAMTSFWPPLGRWSGGYKAVRYNKNLSFLPKNVIAGKVGYSLMPGGHGAMTGGYELGVSPDSKHQLAAYLFEQWLTSPKISLKRVELPYALRDPYRLSHVNSPSYRHLWPDAGKYLGTLLRASNTALITNTMPGTAQYDDALDKEINAAYSGLDPKTALDTTAQQWDTITQRLGVPKQRSAYKAFLKIPGSQLSNTINH